MLRTILCISLLSVSGAAIASPANVQYILNGKLVDVTPTTPLPVTGGGGGGGGGDASAANQTTQITRETEIRDRLGALTSPDTGSVNGKLSALDTLLRTTGIATHGVTQSGNWNVGITGTPAVSISGTPTVNLGTLNGAATAANQTAMTAALPTKDGNGDLRVPTVTVTAWFVSLSANTNTQLLAASSTRIGYDIQCTGTAAVGVSRTGQTLSSATPASGGADLVIPAGTTPYFQPSYDSRTAITAYSTSAQSCWGNSYARQ